MIRASSLVISDAYAVLFERSCGVLEAPPQRLATTSLETNVMVGITKAQTRPAWQVQQRAWECSRVLKDQPLEPRERVSVDLVYRMFPDDIGWLDVCRMFLLYRDVMGARG
jgi:hypothetical protein